MTHAKTCSGHQVSPRELVADRQRLSARGMAVRRLPKGARRGREVARPVSISLLDWTTRRTGRRPGAGELPPNRSESSESGREAQVSVLARPVLRLELDRKADSSRAGHRCFQRSGTRCRRKPTNEVVRVTRPADHRRPARRHAPSDPAHGATLGSGPRNRAGGSPPGRRRPGKSERSQRSGAQHLPG